MLVVDVNVLLYALDRDSPRHATCLKWLERAGAALEPVGVSSQTTAAVLRIATQPGMASRVMSPAAVIDFLEDVRNLPAVGAVEPGPGHWPVFAKLVLQHDLRRGDLTDGWLAALALELGAKLVTTDGGFARFRGLHVIDPTAEA